MYRRQFLETTVMGAAAMAMSGCVTGHKSAKSPNVILIMTDDQGYGDLACHGHPWIKPPPSG